MTMQYAGLSLPESAVKYPRSIHRSYSGPSTSAGAYEDGRLTVGRGCSAVGVVDMDPMLRMRTSPPRTDIGIPMRAWAPDAHRSTEVLMRAMVYSAPLTLEMQDVPEPEPGPGEVVVEVAAAGICGSELEGVASRSPFRVPPLVMGHEFAGTVVGTGRRVVVNPLVNCRECDLCVAGATNVCRRRVTLGVHRPGGFAERVAVLERNLVDLPDDVGWAQAAMIEPLAHAVHAARLATAPVPLPRRLGVLGAGAIGLAVVVVAVDREIPEVHAVDLLEEKLAT